MLRNARARTRARTRTASPSEQPPCDFRGVSPIPTPRRPRPTPRPAPRALTHDFRKLSHVSHVPHHVLHQSCPYILRPTSYSPASLVPRPVSYRKRRRHATHAKTFVSPRLDLGIAAPFSESMILARSLHGPCAVGLSWWVRPCDDEV